MKVAAFSLFAAIAVVATQAAEDDALKQELMDWKHSDAGQYAIANGFVPTETTSNLESDEPTEEELRRFQLAKDRIEKAQQTNPLAKFSTATPFSLMTSEEFAAFVGKSFQQDMPDLSNYKYADFNETDSHVLDDSVDWSSNYCVGPIKDQGQCGSCWAFSAVGVLESAYCLRNGWHRSFSEQQLTSCDSQNGGCNGGWEGRGLEYVNENGGICTSESYPYVSGQTKQSEQCNLGNCDKVGISLDVIRVPKSEDAYLNAINGMPLSVVVGADDVWMNYKGGIVTSCPTTGLNHAVIAVGYGTSERRYYKIRNSWGSWWGDNGHIYLARDGSTCGVMNDFALYPQLK